MMKLQLRKTQNGVLALTDEDGEILPSQVSVQVIGEKIIVEFGLWDDGISLSDKAASTRVVTDDWTKLGRDRELS